MLQFGLEAMACDAFYVAVFRSLCFPPVHTRNGAFSKRCNFKRLHFWNRFRKSPFSSAFSGVFVWMIGENVSKSMVFKWKRISVHGYGVALTLVLFHQGLEWSLIGRVFPPNWQAKWLALSMASTMWSMTTVTSITTLLTNSGFSNLPCISVSLLLFLCYHEKNRTGGNTLEWNEWNIYFKFCFIFDTTSQTCSFCFSSSHRVWRLIDWLIDWLIE